MRTENVSGISLNFGSSSICFFLFPFFTCRCATILKIVRVVCGFCYCKLRRFMMLKHL
ncbi:hypothetical protein Hanom_Chr12g01117361 [Helianthus anomalus]